MILAYMLQRYTPNCYYKKNVQFTLEQAMKTQRSVQRYSSTLSLTSPVDWGGGWGVNATRQPLYPWGRQPVPIVVRLDGSPGQDKCGKSRPHQHSIPEKRLLHII